MPCVHVELREFELKPKMAGGCLSCGTECYTVLERNTEGLPTILGSQLECGTQVEFLLSNGSEAGVTFCLDCANALTPADYGLVWQTCLEANLRVLARRPRNQIIAALNSYGPLWIVAKVRKRRESGQPDRQLVVDRR